MIRAMLTTALMLVLSAEAMAQTPEMVRELELKLQALRQTDAAAKAQAEAARKAAEVAQLAAKIEELNAQLALLQKMKADAAVEKAAAADRQAAEALSRATAKDAPKAPVKPADKVAGVQADRVRVLTTDDLTMSGTVTLNRRTFKLPKEKLAALDAFLTANVKGVVLETKVTGDTMTVTTTPEVMKTLSGLVDLMNGGKKMAIFWQGDPKVNGGFALGDITGQIELQLSADSLKFDKFEVKPVLDAAPKVWKVITGEKKTEPAVPTVPKVPEAPKPPVAPKPPAAPEAPKVRAIVPKPPAAPKEVELELEFKVTPPAPKPQPK